MTIKPRGKSWQATVHWKGERFRKDFNTEAEAQAWELETKAALLRGRRPDAEKAAEGTSPTIGAFLRDIVEPYWQTRKSADGLIENGRMVAKVLGEERPVSSLSIADADKVRKHWRGLGRSDATVNRKLAALSVIVKMAHERDHLTRKFSVGITKERNSGRRRIVSPEEETAMLRYCEVAGQGALRDYVIVSLDTGLRQGEVLRLTSASLDGGLVTVYDTKNGGHRSVPLTERARTILEERARVTGQGKPLFPYKADWLIEQWHKMRTWLCISDADFVPHAMRHTFVTRLLRAGVDIKTVQELAGHLNIATTQIYAHSGLDAKTVAIQRLSAYTPHATPVA